MRLIKLTGIMVLSLGTILNCAEKDDNYFWLLAMAQGDSAGAPGAGATDDGEKEGGFGSAGAEGGDASAEGGSESAAGGSDNSGSTGGNESAAGGSDNSSSTGGSESAAGGSDNSGSTGGSESAAGGSDNSGSTGGSESAAGGSDNSGSTGGSESAAGGSDNSGSTGGSESAAGGSDNSGSTGGSESAAGGSSGNSGSASNGKIAICHIPPGNPNNPQDISIGAAAWPAHEAHGDKKGSCSGSAATESAASGSESSDSENASNGSSAVVSEATIKLNDNKDSTYKVELIGVEGATWTYRVSHVKGRDLSHWNVGLDESCRAAVQSGTTGYQVGKDGSTGFWGIKWDSQGGVFSFTLDGEYPSGNVQVLAKAGTQNNTALITGPTCNGYSPLAAYLGAMSKNNRNLALGIGAFALLALAGLMGYSRLKKIIRNIRSRKESRSQGLLFFFDSPPGGRRQSPQEILR